MPRVLHAPTVAASLPELWSPRVVAEVDEVYVKVARVKGEMVWHSHENEDELFLVLKGKLRLEIEGDEPVELEEGELFVMPKGVRHLPIAEEECHLLLIERKSTLHTGGEASEHTRSIEKQLRPV
jgi:quercetin dioxygenase-like cupin family protein